MGDIIFSLILGVACIGGLFCIVAWVLEKWEETIGARNASAQEYRDSLAGYKRYAKLSKRPDLRVVRKEGE